MQKRSKRILAATLAAVGVIAAGGVAYAFSEFVNTGAVSGSAAQMEPLTVSNPTTQYANGETSLWPGENHMASVVLTVNNPNEVAVKVTNLDVVKNSITIGGPASCTTAIVENGTLNIDNGVGGSGNNITVPAHTDATIRLVNVFWLAASAPNECQGRTINSNWKVTANSL